MNPFWLSGWTFLGHRLLLTLPPEARKALRKVGSSYTINEGDRLLHFKNDGTVTGSTKRPVVRGFRRFVKKRGNLK